MIASVMTAILAATLVGTPSDNGGDGDRSRELDASSLRAMAEQVRAAHDQPALAAAVVRSDGEPIAAAAGRRQVNADDPVERDDRFHFGSCAKALTATVIGRLVDEGRLAWDDQVLDFFPEHAETAREAYRDITIRELLSHRAGIVPATAGASPESIALQQLSGSPREQRAAAVGVVLAMEPVVKPGAATQYSNAGYGLAAAVAEQVTGESWETLVRTHVFEPLGMERAGFGWPATDERPDQPRGHWAGPKEVVPLPLDATYRLATAIAPAGDVHGSIEDLARFAQAHHVSLRGGSSLLSQASAVVLHTPIDDDSPYAMGWLRRNIAGHEASWHNGSAGTFFTWMTIWPEHDLAIVVATNAGNGEQACAEMTQRAFDAVVPSDRDDEAADDA